MDISRKNYGVLGASGTGKSSLINAILGKRPSDPGAARVNAVAQETLKPQSFQLSEQVLVWDMPGVGTPEFPFRE